MAGAVECRTPIVAAALDTTFKSCKEDTGHSWGFYMARNRMLNPEFWLDEELAALSPHARLLYMGLWGICDDHHATIPDKPAWIKIQVFPYEDVDIKSLLAELEGAGKVIKFESEDKNWWYLKNFLKHQKIDRPSKEKYAKYRPPRTILHEPSTSPRPELKELKEKKEGFNKIEPPSSFKTKTL